jgi:hypothetical protein
MTNPIRLVGVPTGGVWFGEIATTPDGTTHYLNGMAALIYELADGRAVESIGTSVATIFDLDPEEGLQLTVTAVDEMRAKGLVG